MKITLLTLFSLLILNTPAFFIYPIISTAKASEYRLIIAQSIKHPALDDVSKGIQDYFTEKNIPASFQSYILNSETSHEYLQWIADHSPHLILTIGTQASQIALEKVTSIPVVFSAVTDPVGAGLVDDLNSPGRLVTGLTDMSPVAAQLDMIIRIQPKLESLGMVYSEFEQNAVKIKDYLKLIAENHGIRLVTAPVTRQDMVLDRASDILEDIDALYVSTDNYVVSSIADLARLCASHKAPLYAADSSSVESGAVASLSINYYRMGLQTGAMSLRILNGADPKSMPVEKPRKFTIAINVQAAEEMEVSLPMDILIAADMVYSSFPGGIREQPCQQFIEMLQ
ncbi:ABC transporter substrate-binding protein [Desulfonatronovibrio magnus]|uniref:ABC transporter substrate-binding protein n=1 Tax=Desulfonatronovibrio magnus TaxID=698827 RepID=UPI000695DBDA|nr:ABC transporter substrate-binding protein [Desulfonatronovibrio magnus]